MYVSIYRFHITHWFSTNSDASVPPMLQRKLQADFSVEEDTETQDGTTRDSSHLKVTMATSLNSTPQSEVLMVSSQDKLKETQLNSHIAIISSRETTGSGE